MITIIIIAVLVLMLIVFIVATNYYYYLLKKYMWHVIDCEGISYVESYKPIRSKFTKMEKETLKKLDKSWEKNNT